MDTMNGQVITGINRTYTLKGIFKRFKLPSLLFLNPSFGYKYNNNNNTNEYASATSPI